MNCLVTVTRIRSSGFVVIDTYLYNTKKLGGFVLSLWEIIAGEHRVCDLSSAMSTVSEPEALITFGHVSGLVFPPQTLTQCQTNR